MSPEHLAQQQHGFWYVASPFTHTDRSVENRRALDALYAVTWLYKQKVNVYSPIHHTSGPAILGGFPTDHTFWQRSNETFIRLSVGLIILELDGWKESKGIAQEIPYALALRKPIFRMSGNQPYELGVYRHGT